MASNIKNIVVLAFNGAQVLDITGPMEVFSNGNQFTDKPFYRIECLGVPRTMIRMSNGLTLSTKQFKSWRGEIDTLVVPGASAEALQLLRNETEFIRWLKERLGKARRIVSVCTGAFVLAELGFLEGRRASTHWNACEQLRTFSPTTQVEPDAIFTKDGNVYTSAGVTTGIDLALSLVEEDLGKEVSLGIARNLVLYLRRSGGQSQFSVPLELQSAHESRIDKILSYIRNNPKAELSVDALASRYAMTPRHLSRLFSAVGWSPAKYVTQVRLETVKKFLESTNSSVGTIATQCGYKTQSTMSKVFKRQYGIAPSDYRERFN